MSKHINQNKIHILELQLEEAIQMLRLVAQNKRTILEVEDWLKQNYSTNITVDFMNDDTINQLLKSAPKTSK